MAWLQDMLTAGSDRLQPEAHWTKRLRRENTTLRETLEWYKLEVRTLMQSRFDKLHDFPTEGGMDSYDLGYQAALQEIDNRLAGLDNEMWSSDITLSEGGKVSSYMEQSR